MANTRKSPEDFGVDLEMIRRLWADPTVPRKAVVAASGLNRAGFDKMVSRMPELGKKPFIRVKLAPRTRVRFDEALLRQMWVGPYSLTEIYTTLGLVKSTFAKVMKRLDLPERPKFKPVEYLRLPQEKIDVVLAAYQAGILPLETIQEKHGVWTQHQHQLAELAGIPRRVWQPRRADSQVEGVPTVARATYSGQAINRGNPIDPDARLLMRDFAPVCRAKTRDPKAPDDLWIVGQMTVPEQRMREMAAKRRPAGEEASPW